MKKDRTVYAAVPPMWKARDMIMGLGGVGGVTEKLIKKGFYPPGPDTVQGWASRNSIPGPWMPAILDLAIEHKLIKRPLNALIKDANL